MRTVTSAQLAALRAAHRIEDLRVWIADVDSTLVDRTAQVLDVEWGSTADQHAVTASITLQLATADESLAPRMSATPPIESAREVVIEVVVAEADATVTSSDWVEVFRGYVDEWADGGLRGELMLTCLDGWYVLQETDIEVPFEYGSEEGEPIDEVLQQYLDETLGVDAPTLAVAGLPTTVVYEGVQQPGKLTQALQRLLDLDGWDLRYRRNQADDGWEFVYFEPPRTTTEPLVSFDAHHYGEISEHRSSLRDVRTVCTVDWAEGEDLVVVEDTAAIAALKAMGHPTGRKVLAVDATRDQQFQSAEMAGRLGDAVVADLSQPLVTATVDLGRVWWPVEIGDLYEFAPDGVHYSEPVVMAVTRWSTRFQRMEGGGFTRSTVLGLRGRPTGGTTRWRRLAKLTFDAHEAVRVMGVPEPPVNVSLAAVFDPDGALSCSADGSPFQIQSWRVAGAIGEMPDEADIEVKAPINERTLAPDLVGTLATAEEGGDVGHVAAIGYSRPDAEGQPTNIFRAAAVFGTSAAGIPDGAVGTPQLADGAVAASKMIAQAQTLSSTITFSSTSRNSISWSSGNVTLAGGSSVSVDAGNRALSNSFPHYIYFDGTATLKVTTVMADITSDPNRILLCTARRTVSNLAGHSNAFFVTTIGQLQVNEDHISPASVTTDHVQANSIKAAQIDVVNLSAISADIGEVVAGMLRNQGSTTFVNLDATGSDDFIRCGDDLVMRADGTAVFAGVVEASSFNAAENLFTGNVMCTIFQGPDATNGFLDFANSGGPILHGPSPHSTRIQVTTTGLAVTGGLTTNGNVVFSGTGTSTRFFGPIGFHGAAAIERPNITGSTQTNLALQNLIAALVNYGLITDSTT